MSSCLPEDDDADVLNYISEALLKQKCQVPLLSGQQYCSRVHHKQAQKLLPQCYKAGEAEQQMQNWTQLNGVQIQVNYILFR